MQESPIVDFYPLNFKIDLNGKKYAWQGVALLPFVDECRLLQALEGVQGDLNEEESKVKHRYKLICWLLQHLSIARLAANVQT